MKPQHALLILMSIGLAFSGLTFSAGWNLGKHSAERSHEKQKEQKAPIPVLTYPSVLGALPTSVCPNGWEYVLEIRGEGAQQFDGKFHSNSDYQGTCHLIQQPVKPSETK